MIFPLALHYFWRFFLRYRINCFLVEAGYSGIMRNRAQPLLHPRRGSAVIGKHQQDSRIQLVVKTQKI